MKRFLGLVGLPVLTALQLQAGPVEEWNQVFISAVQAEATSPCLAARNLAILHTAVHDAVNKAVPQFELYLKQETGTPVSHFPASAISAEAAAASAAYTVATALYPARVADFESFLTRQLAGFPNREAMIRGQEVGREAACRLLELRSHDGSSTTEHYVPRDAPGQWRRPPSNRPPEMPGWRHVTLFCLEKPDQFAPPGPPALGSAAYAEDFDVLRRLGGASSTGRTPQQTELAKFWADFAYTSTPPGHWNEIARFLSLKQHLSLHETARLFAWLNLAMADTGVATWDCKYQHNFWRPHTAISRAATDGNDSTEADPAWKPLLKVPPHPEYVSGHSAFSGAAAAVLGQVFGQKDIEFQVTSYDLPGMVRTYHSFAECRDEISLSRVWGGIHFPSACRDGKILGEKIAGFVLAKKLGKIADH